MPLHALIGDPRGKLLGAGFGLSFDDCVFRTGVGKDGEARRRDHASVYLYHIVLICMVLANICIDGVLEILTHEDMNQFATDGGPHGFPNHCSGARFGISGSEQ